MNKSWFNSILWHITSVASHGHRVPADLHKYPAYIIYELNEYSILTDRMSMNAFTPAETDIDPLPFFLLCRL